MKKWEYFIVITCNNRLGRQEQLDSAGSDGWELVSVNVIENGRCREYTFKRAIAHIEYDGR